MKTYALIAGVEKYKGPWSLNGPANDAMNIAHYLLDHGVESQNVSLFLSPLDPNGGAAKAARLPWREATRDNVRNEMTRIRNEAPADSLFFLYWSGHGVMTHGKTRRLLFADSDRSTMVNLNLESLLTSLKTEYFRSQHSIVITDACANHAELLRLPYDLPDESFTMGAPNAKHEQFVVVAARDGQVAINLDAEKKGQFTKELLQCLASYPEFPPDMNTLARQVAERFTELRRQGQVKQTPAYFEWRDWGGNSVALGSLPAGKPLAASQVKNLLSVPELRKVTNALCMLPWLLDANERWAVLRQVRSEIVKLIPQYNTPQTAIYAIVETCSRYPNALGEFLRAVRFMGASDPGLETLDAVLRRTGLPLDEEEGDETS